MNTKTSVNASVSNATEPSSNEENPHGFSPNGPVILFDGQCNLCHWALGFIVARDYLPTNPPANLPANLPANPQANPPANPQAALGRFRFAPLQGDTAKTLIKQCTIPQAEVDALTSTQSGSFVLIDAGRYYLRSDAALKVCSQLTGFWPYLAYLSIIPTPIRDGLYRFVGRNRYRLFGQRPLCLLPSTAIRQRFLP
jgi:predicted DCC family thiol-disulfide oxidoreductase YuxK